MVDKQSAGHSYFMVTGIIEHLKIALAASARC